MYNLLQIILRLNDNVDYRFKRLCSDLHQMFQLSAEKRKYEKDTIETVSKERYNPYDNNNLNSFESVNRLSKRHTKPRKLPSNCKYASTDRCSYIHFIADKVERKNQLKMMLIKMMWIQRI